MVLLWYYLMYYLLYYYGITYYGIIHGITCVVSCRNATFLILVVLSLY